MFNMVEEGSSKEPFSAIKALLKHKTLVVWLATIGMALITAWLGFRTGFVELYIFAVIIAAATYGIVTVAVDVVELVVQTLMPQ